jgi:hypothetical protein
MTASMFNSSPCCRTHGLVCLCAGAEVGTLGTAARRIDGGLSGSRIGLALGVRFGRPGRGALDLGRPECRGSLLFLKISLLSIRACSLSLLAVTLLAILIITISGSFRVNSRVLRVDVLDPPVL